MGRTPRQLDPGESPAALFGAQLRTARLAHGLSAAALGAQVHVSGDLITKVEKAQRRPQPGLVEDLDRVLGASGALVALGGAFTTTIPDAASPNEITAPALREVIDRTRTGDHVMASATALPALVAHAKAAQRATGDLTGRSRTELRGLVAQAYQLAGWMSFDQAAPRRATALLKTARSWAGQADDAGLVAFVLGPNASFVATSNGDPATGVELGYAAMGWAQRSGNHRLTAFTAAIAARAHARLRETRPCLDLLDHAADHLARHITTTDDPAWLAVFDTDALAGHRGSCLLDLGLPDQAVDPLHQPDVSTTAGRFIRNRVLWQLDRAAAQLRLDELDAACATIDHALTLATGPISTRVRLRFQVLRLALPDTPATRERIERLTALTAVPG